MNIIIKNIIGIIQCCVVVQLILLYNYNNCMVGAGNECSGDNECIVNTTYTSSVTESNPGLYRYIIDFTNYTEKQVLDTILQFEVSVDIKTSWRDPVLISIHQVAHVTNIKLPFSFDDNPTDDSIWYFSTTKTLCLTYSPTKIGQNRTESLIITAYTTLHNEDGAIDFNYILIKTNGLFVGIDEVRNFTVSPLGTTYYRFDFDANQVYMIEILLTSQIDEGGDICTILASHDPYCPVLDQEENVQKISYKKFTQTAVMRQWKDEFPKGFTIVIVPQSNDYDCTRDKSLKNPKKTITHDVIKYREKTISLTIRKVNEVKLREMFFLPLVALFLPCLIFATILFFIFEKKFKSEYIAVIERNNLTSSSPNENNVVEENVIGLNERKNDNLDVSQQLRSIESGLQIEPELDEYDHVTYEHITGTYEDIAGRKARYCSVTCVVSIYYIIPAFQLLLYHVEGMRSTGNYDRCYYNELCRIRTHGISDFNHVISNGLYILFGIFFILFVGRRKSTIEKSNETNQHLNIKRGVRIPYGAYYAMGISLIMEGFLSSAYHLCPSGTTFQFDVAFMNIIAAIIISTLHQLRYRLVPSGAKTFVFLSFLVMISAIFFASETYWSYLLAVVFRIIFCTFHILVAFVYCVGLYYYGCLRDLNDVKIADFRKVLKLIFIPTCTPIFLGFPQSLPLGKILRTNVTHRGMKLFTCLLLFISNAGATIILGLSNDFAHHLLFIMILNTMLSFIIYINWKIYYKEYSILMIQPMIYILLAGLFGTCAIRKFKKDLTEWNATPAQSRILNQPCSELWGGYYDQHDVWHFFSAVALFYSFMSLLTIDDGIMMKRRRDIKIF